MLTKDRLKILGTNVKAAVYLPLLLFYLAQVICFSQKSCALFYTAVDYSTDFFEKNFLKEKTLDLCGFLL